MKILYAIQGTGNGHVSRAREIIPILKKYGELDILISGTQADVNLDEEIKYQFKGFGFDFGTKGGIDYRSSFRKADFNINIIMLAHSVNKLIGLCVQAAGIQAEYPERLAGMGCHVNQHDIFRAGK